MAPKIETAWGQVDLSNLMPSEFADVIDVAEAAVTFLAGILETIGAVLEIVVITERAATDLLRAAFDQLVELVEAAVEFFVATSISVAHFIPTSWKSAPNVPLLVEKFARSFDDETDVNRPLGGSDENYFVLFLALATGPNPVAVLNVLEPLLALFRLPLPGVNLALDHRSYLEQVLGEPPTWPPTARVGQGQAPDWTTVRLADFGPIGEAVKALLSLRDSLKKTSDNLSMLVARANLILKRAALIQAGLADLVEAIEAFYRVLEDMTGITGLLLHGQGSVLSQREALRAALGAGDNPFIGSDGAEFAGGICLHVQSGIGATIEVAKTLLGATRLGARKAYTQELEEKYAAPVSVVASNVEGVKKGAKEIF